MDKKQSSAAKWMEDDTQLFVKYGEFFTPGRDEQYQMVCELVESAPKQMGKTPIVELCCGTGCLARYILERLPQVSVIAFDGSETMLDVAARNCAEFGDRFCTSLFRLEVYVPELIPSKVSAIISCLSIHHLDADQKRVLFGQVYRSLVDGGVFVIADIMMPTSQRGIDISRRAWDRAVREVGSKTTAPKDTVEKFKAERWNFFESPYDDPIDHPSTVNDHLSWLLDAGFLAVDVHWMKAGHAIISASRNSS